REDREAILHRQRGCDAQELAYLFGCGLDAVLGRDPGRVLLHRVPRPRRTACGAAIERAACESLHGEVIQRRWRTTRTPAQRVWVVAGLPQLGHPCLFFAESGGLLRGALIRPCFRREPGGDDRPHRLAGMRRLPLGFEPFEMLAYLLAALAHHAVELLELGHLARYRVKGQA